MDLTFSDEQSALRDGLARYLDRSYSFDHRQELLRSSAPYDDAVWSHFVALGLTALPFPDDLGGLGGTAVDVVAVAEILGEYLTLEPYAASVLLGGAALLVPGVELLDRARELVRGVIDGGVVVAFAHEEGRGSPSAVDVRTAVQVTGDGAIVSGRKELVLGAPEAAELVVTARVRDDADGGIALLLVDPQDPAVTMRPYRTIDGRSAASVVFDAAQAVVLSDDAGEHIDRVIGAATLGLAAEAVGAMGALLRDTVQYAKTRQQFGVPIATFQVLGHRLADMKMAYTTVRATLLYTAALVESGRGGPAQLAVLKAQVGRLGRQIAEAAIQIHGGIGTTDELPIGHYAKRILAVDAMFGDSTHHLSVVGATAGK